jgi:hypothetical protein
MYAREVESLLRFQEWLDSTSYGSTSVGPRGKGFSLDDIPEGLRIGPLMLDAIIKGYLLAGYEVRFDQESKKYYFFRK